MIDERQRKAIEMLVSGEHSKTDIALNVAVSRTTLYSWINDDEEFKAEVDKRLQRIKTQAEKELNSKLPMAIDLYWELATSPKTDSRTKQIALSYVIDRCLGRTTAKIDVTAQQVQASITDDDILSAIDEARVNNIIDEEE